MKPPQTPCAKCSGSGKTPLQPELVETLAMLPRIGSVTTKTLHERFPAISPNAQINRLERLRALGLVARQREGKFFRYSRIPSTTKAK